jgi:hypothetical protein
MNGKNYYIPSLSHEVTSSQHEVELSVLIEGETELSISSGSCLFIGLAVRRNYPDVTDGQLMDLLDRAHLHSRRSRS